MRCFVTGASGFIGSNLVRELLAQQHSVKVLVRQGSDTRALDGADVELVTGHLTDREFLRRELRDSEWCFHCAADYRLWAADYRPMYVTNVEGTFNIIEAAGRYCSRIVYTSTVGCIGLPREVNGRIIPATERDSARDEDLTNDYKRSKWQAELVAIKAARDGLPVVIVNPSAPVGARDVKPTPTGQVIVDFLNGKLPAFVDTGLNWVHVRDVAIGHILAAQKGVVGQRYILGHKEGNWTMEETLKVLEEITGKPAPKKKVPHWVALMAAHVQESTAYFTKKPPRAPLAGVRMSKYKMWFDPSKAVKELGLPQTSPRQAFVDAIEWFRAHDYVRPVVNGR